MKEEAIQNIKEQLEGRKNLTELNAALIGLQVLKERDVVKLQNSREETLLIEEMEAKLNEEIEELLRRNPNERTGINIA